MRACQRRQAFDSSPWVRYCFCFLVLGCLLEARQLQLRDEFANFWLRRDIGLAGLIRTSPGFPAPPCPLPPCLVSHLLLLPSVRDQAQVALSLVHASRWWILAQLRLAAVSSLFPLPWRSGRCEVFDSYLQLRPPAFLPLGNAFSIPPNTTTHRACHSNSPCRSPTIVGASHHLRPSSLCFCNWNASIINFDSALYYYFGHRSSLPWPHHSSQRPWSLTRHAFLTDQPAWASNNYRIIQRTTT